MHLLIRTITCFIVLAAALITTTGAPLHAGGYPHYLQNDIDCSNCHNVHGSQPQLIWEQPVQQDIDHTQANQLCWSCHNGSDASAVLSHSSLQTGNSYGNWTVECAVCHDPHFQLQAMSYPDDVVAEGVVAAADATSLTKTGAESWIPDAYKGMILFPNINRLDISYKIVSNSADTLTVDPDATTPQVDGSMDLTQAAAGNIFIISYGKLIRDRINLGLIAQYASTNLPLPEPVYPKSGIKEVKLFRPSGSNSFADGNATMNGICEVCHTETRHFRNNGLAPNQLHSVDQNGTPAKVGGGNNCTMCHKHENGFAVNMPSHSATPGSDWVMVFEDGSHDSAMVGDAEVEVECRLCHNTELPAAHDYQCLACHPSPAGTVAGSWGGGCQQGGCHTTIHENVSAAHNIVADNYPVEWDYCTQCHEYPNPPGNWTPTSAACPNCHAVYNPADTTPPVTTSNAKASYLGPARIEYSVRDSGKVVVAQSYSSVDDGPAVMGSSIVIMETGNHNLKFWSVDQANNTEWPPKEANFEILQDTTPPVTTSDAKALPYIYYNAARIWFSSSDDGELGVKTTKYSLDGGPTNTGNSVYVSGALGTVNHTLKFWSEDWSGNVEDSSKPENNVTFTISKGTGTFRMWGGGTSCANDPDADAYWVIYKDKYQGNIVAEGTDGCDVVLPVSATGYFVMVYWWNYNYNPGFWDEEYYGTPGNYLFYLTTNGQVIELD